MPVFFAQAEIFGIKLVGASGHNVHKILLTAAFLAVVWLVGAMLKWFASKVPRDAEGKRLEFWTKQGVHLVTAALAILGLMSIWFDDPRQLASFAGLLTAGLAFALQKVVTAVAGYFVLLRGKIFNVGDRIMMGGVRGDVIALGFIRTTILEMGQPPGEQNDPPSMWVASRQYTGRIVTVTNDKIFDEPVYNYSRDFPFIFEEMHIPVSYQDNAHAAERILLEVAEKHTAEFQSKSHEWQARLQRKYFVRPFDTKPCVYWRITDNWIELAVRFIAPQYGIRELKDQMSRDIMAEFDKAKIGIASGTYQVVGMPPIRVKLEPPNNA